MASTPTPLEAHLAVAHGRARDSLDVARRLADVGFHDPAFVWAVRSVEIFTKEWLLAPAYALHLELTLSKALRKAGGKFGSSNWVGAFAEIERLCGPVDSMLTEDDEDAWRYWENRVVRHRGDIVHGRPGTGAGPEEAAGAIRYANQLITQLTFRMLVTERHPAGQHFRDVFERASASYQADQGRRAGMPDDPAVAPGADTTS